jgi:hypothetical protein
LTGTAGSFEFVFVIEDAVVQSFTSATVKVAEDGAFEQFVLSVRQSDYVSLTESQRASSSGKVELFRTFDEAAPGAFRYDLLCQKRYSSPTVLPFCDYCKENGHIEHFCDTRKAVLDLVSQKCKTSILRQSTKSVEPKLKVFSESTSTRTAGHSSKVCMDAVKRPRDGASSPLPIREWVTNGAITAHALSKPAAYVPVLQNIPHTPFPLPPFPPPNLPYSFSNQFSLPNYSLLSEQIIKGQFQSPAQNNFSSSPNSDVLGSYKNKFRNVFNVNRPSSYVYNHRNVSNIQIAQFRPNETSIATENEEQLRQKIIEERKLCLERRTLQEFKKLNRKVAVGKKNQNLISII